MELRRKRRFGAAFWSVVALVVVCVAAGIAMVMQPASLTATESSCVGSWAYISPDHSNKTCIVYRFAADRSVREEHYYLESAYPPTVPRISLVGKWSVDKGGCLIVEPNRGPWYLRDAMSGWLNEYLDDGRQAWDRPILPRLFDVRSATSAGLQVECSRSGGGRMELTMLPFLGDPAAIPTP